MYLFFGILVLLLIFCSLFCFFRKKRICKKVRCMDTEEKCSLLNSLIEPFGFTYDLCTDLFISGIDAWQKNFGYCRFYDETAPSMNMIFDCEPIYFDYANRTWLIEFWKGQYGINTGAEVGIYYADSVLEEKERETTLFSSVSETELLPISYELTDKNNQTIFRYAKPHWWLACFRMGTFSWPKDLRLRISISFPNDEMKNSYVKALLNTGYTAGEIYVRRQTVSVYFTVPTTPQPKRRIRSHIAQWLNRSFIHLYLFTTKPFQQTLDRLLYLYYSAPRLFRRALTARSRQKRYKKRDVS